MSATDCSVVPELSERQPGRVVSGTACPLCRRVEAQRFCSVGHRSYFACDHCSLRFLDPAQRPGRLEEKQEYDLHDNNPDDPGYRRFLSALVDPLVRKLEADSIGLDYGCGSGPAVSAMMRAAGHRMREFDPIFRPDRRPLTERYDVITCTEVAEHFHDPRGEFNRLDGLLRRGAYLGIMTRFQTDDARFAQWHYRRDPTHVAFYREETMAWIANHWGWTLDLRPPSVAIFQKPGAKERG